jgi:hypothetical protein
MAQYVPYHALVAAPLHKLTRKDQSFPIGSKWILGSDYDIVGKLVAAHGYRQKRENKLEIKK